jgi:hypothetical protein
MKRSILLCMVISFGAPVARGQTPAAPNPEDRAKVLEERVRALEEQVQSLRSALEDMKTALSAAAAPPSVPAAPVPQIPATAPGEGGAALPVYGGSPLAAKALNPDVSAIGDFLGAIGHNTVQPAPALELHEMEVGLQAIIDPYARGDVFLSFGESGVNLEEGYMTFTSLPAGFVAKVGKMRAAFGQVNLTHNHALPTVDRPLVTDNLVGGEDGIDDAGISLSRILPAPKGLFLEGTAQVYRGDSEDVFHSSRPRDVSTVGHLRAYHDFSDSTNLDLGVSYARGHNNLGDPFITQLWGIDSTLRWKPLRRAIYHSFLWRNEFIWSRRDQVSNQQRAFGLYSYAEYRLNRRWTVGGRFDRSGQAQNASLIDNGFSAVLTYWPSEFSQVRGQYRWTRYDTPGNVAEFANEFRFQFLFVLGAHGAHPF